MHPALLAALLAPQDQDHSPAEVRPAASLKLQLSGSPSYDYDQKIEFEVQGQNMVYTSQIRRSYQAGSGGSWSLKLEETKAKLAWEESEMALPQPPAKTFELGSGGQVGAPSGAKLDPSDLRFQRLISFFYPSGPVPVGQPWRADWKGGSAKEVPGGSATCRVTGQQPLGNASFWVAVCRVEESDQGASALSTFWLDEKTGLVKKGLSELENAPLANGKHKARWTLVHRAEPSK